jgi:hypothetical protein
VISGEQSARVIAMLLDDFRGKLTTAKYATLPKMS